MKIFNKNKDNSVKTKIPSVFSNIDYRVLAVFGIIIGIGLLILFLKEKKKIDCDIADFTIQSEKNTTGEYIEFINNTPNAEEWAWNFGDSTAVETKSHAYHKYEKAGVYTISLTINNYCVKQKQIEIRQGDLTDNFRIPKIIAPELVTVGQDVRFKFSYFEETYSWEWGFGETGKIDRTDENPVYNFQTPGKKTIYLILNGDVEHKAKKDIYVRPRELSKKKDTLEAYNIQVAQYENPESNPTPDKSHELIAPIPIKRPAKTQTIAPDISTDEFELLVYQLANQNKSVKDFTKYFPLNNDVPVIINENKIMKFSEFCKKVQNKTIKIDNIRLTKDNLNYISGFSINYKIKKYLLWWTEK